MKTNYQIASFLSQQPIRSLKDFERISSMCHGDDRIRFSKSYEIDEKHGITVYDFLDWEDNGFGAGDVCWLEDELVICGICHLRSSRIVGKMKNDKIYVCDLEVAQKGLKTAFLNERTKFYIKMAESGFQFDLKECCLTERWLPRPGERVIFTSDNGSGIGVVKTLHHDTNSVDYFCYYKFETGEVGYSMDEKNITPIAGVLFEPMNNSLQRQTKGNGVYLQRKLNKVLAAYGKTWNEKLHRIEPLKPLVDEGEPYWYISDKLELCSDYERGKKTSKLRYYAANYFKTYQEGLEYLGLIAELLRARYGKPENPEEDKG